MEELLSINGLMAILLPITDAHVVSIFFFCDTIANITSRTIRQERARVRVFLSICAF